MTQIHDRLAELGLTLPQAAAPVASYVPAVEANGLLHISGQVSQENGQLIKGRLGEDMDLEAGIRAARTPYSRSRSSPSRPVSSWPSSKDTWPEMWSRFPTSTVGT